MGERSLIAVAFSSKARGPGKRSQETGLPECKVSLTVEAMSELEALFGTKGEIARVATLLLSSGDLLFKQGKAKEAEEPYRQALAIFERAADRTGVAQS